MELVRGPHVSSAPYVTVARRLVFKREMEQTPLERRDVARAEVELRFNKLEAAVERGDAVASKRYIALLRAGVAQIVASGDEFVREIAEVAFDARAGKYKPSQSVLARKSTVT